MKILVISLKIKSTNLRKYFRLSRSLMLSAASRGQSKPRKDLWAATGSLSEGILDEVILAHHGCHQLLVAVSLRYCEGSNNGDTSSDFPRVLRRRGHKIPTEKYILLRGAFKLIPHTIYPYTVFPFVSLLAHLLLETQVFPSFLSLPIP